MLLSFITLGQGIDILIENLYVYDPKNGMDGQMDVNIVDGRIA